jgi:hypothetical protein
LPLSSEGSRSSDTADKKRRLLAAVDGSIEVLGRVASTAFRYSFKTVQKRNWESVADDPEPLERHIHAVFSSSADVLIEIMNKNLCREFGLKYVEGRRLADYVREALA